MYYMTIAPPTLPFFFSNVELEKFLEKATIKDVMGIINISSWQ